MVAVLRGIRDRSGIAFGNARCLYRDRGRAGTVVTGAVVVRFAPVP